MSVSLRRSRLRAALSVVASLALAAGLVVAVASPASASTIVLCKGYSSCVSYGMTTHGYSKAGSASYWRMYSGHNCTNYAAYMMIKAGKSATRPWTGNGGADGWGVANKSKMNSTPVVGSVAWWSVRSGHVAYVEAVLSPTQIIITEDNWNGDFYWKLLTKDAGGWPDGFIHFKDSKTAGTVPEFRGREYSQTVYTDATRSRLADTTVMKPGSTAWVEARFLNTGTGTWSGLTLATASGGASAIDSGWGSPTSIATQQESTVAPGGTATFGFPIRIPDGLADQTPVKEKFVAVLPDETKLAYSTFHFEVTADSRFVFTAQPAPTVTGTPAEGQVLTATTGTWRPTGATANIQWERNGKVVPGATTNAYTLTDDDVGRTMTVSVTATADGFIPVTKSSGSTAIVTSASPNSFANGTILNAGDQIVSINGKYRLYQRSDGALVLQNRLTGSTVWSNHARGKASYTRFNASGSLSSYSSSGKRIWTTGTKKGAVTAYLMSTGKFQLRSESGKVLWSVG
jgi:surface antigen